MAITVYDVPADLLIEQVATDLKGKVQPPAFAPFVKSGAHRERAPQNPDWYYIRCASILRRLFVDGVQGTESLRTYYGGKKARGTKPHEFRKSSGKIIRSCLQNLEKAGLIIKDPKKKGRIVSPQGESYLNGQAKILAPKADELRKQRTERKRAKLASIVHKGKEPGAREAKRDKKGGEKKKQGEGEDLTAIKLKKKQK
ncbi:MAG: 30S ribosomal protein S19e [Candidatus Diapherotrites archaeon]